MKSNDTSIYTAAALAIQKTVASTQTTLDETALRARHANLAELRRLALEGEDPQSAAGLVAALVSSTLTVGRASDNYPIVGIPESTRKVLAEAARANVLRVDSYYRIGELSFHSDFSGLARDPKCLAEDREAWRNATNYRDNTKGAATL